jgi:glutamate carboxypeptidase
MKARAPSPIAALSDSGTRILHEVRARRGEWAQYVEDLARLESPTWDPGSQEAVRRKLAESLEQLGLRVRQLSRPTGTGLLVASATRSRGQAVQLVLGHTDTVWPIGTLERIPVTLDGRLLRGPGVFDMKAGLASIVVALRVLARLGLAPALAPIVLVNSDEESGSRGSQRHIRRLARRASRAFVLEPALGQLGCLKTARRGIARYTVRIVGRAAHAGLDPERGASAVRELASVVDRLCALAEPSRGVFVNVGRVEGGTFANVVATEASADVDVRFESAADGARLDAAIRGMDSTVPGCSLAVFGGIERPPMERTARNQSLWEAARQVASSLGITIDEGLAGGGSDGSTTSQETATLDGLGAVGDGAHADHEHVDVDRSLERCALFASLLLLPELTRSDAGGSRS